MKKIDKTIEWLVSATKALQEVENHLRELNHELDTKHRSQLTKEIIAEYGPDKVDNILDYVDAELGEKQYEMTVRELMDDIGSAEMCEWCGETTNQYAAEIMSELGTEKVCIYCKGNG
jgi:hypothetical protein